MTKIKCMWIMVLAPLAISCSGKRDNETTYALNATQVESIRWGGLALNFGDTEEINVINDTTIHSSHGPPIKKGATYKYKSAKFAKSDIENLLNGSAVCLRSNSQELSHCGEIPIILRRVAFLPDSIDLFYVTETRCEKDYNLLCRDMGIAAALEVIRQESP